MKCLSMRIASIEPRRRLHHGEGLTPAERFQLRHAIAITIGSPAIRASRGRLGAPMAITSWRDHPRCRTHSASVAPFEHPGVITSTKPKSRSSYSVTQGVLLGKRSRRGRLLISRAGLTGPVNITWIGSSVSSPESGHLGDELSVSFEIPSTERVIQSNPFEDELILARPVEAHRKPYSEIAACLDFTRLATSRGKR